MKTKVAQTLPIFLALLSISWACTCSSVVLAQVDSTDAYDAVLLYRPAFSLNSDKMFEEMCKYFGLRCRKVNITTEAVSDSLFIDAKGLPIRVGAISALALCASSGWVDSTEVSVLTQRIDSGTLNLLVMDAISVPSIPTFDKLSRLTHGEILGAATPVRSTKNYTVSVSRPDICRELSGQSFAYNEAQTDFEVALAGQSSHVTQLVTSNDASGNPFPVMVMYSNGGSVFVSSGTEYRNPETTQLMSLFNERYFSGVVLLAIFLKYAGGSECWHRDFDLANFTIDDLLLTLSLGNFSYSQLLEQMIQHHFHTTISFEPWAFLSSDVGVISLFLENPGYFSLVQHGNNHDGYEFYRYAVSPGDPYPARPLNDQDVDIVEGMYRMLELQRIAGLHSGRIMVFPFGSSPQQTYSLLKQYNFLATVNGSVTGGNLPLDATAPTYFSFDMYPACLDYEDFAAMYRWSPAIPFSRVPLQLFVDKPALTYEHLPYFSSTMTAFNSFADKVNSLNANVVWASLEYVSTHNWLMKEKDDGTFDVMFFGRGAVVSNPTPNARVLRLRTQEDLALPILDVKVNGVRHAYSTNDPGFLTVEVQLAPGDSADVGIEYGQGDIDFAISRDDLTAGFVLGADSARVPVHNYGSKGGAVVVEFFNGEPSSGEILVAYRTVWIPGFGTDTVSIPWDWDTLGDLLYVSLDPYDFTHELREDNNEASLREEDAFSNRLRITGGRPNPFVSTTRISFDIPLPEGTVLGNSPLPTIACELKITDFCGRTVARLFHGRLAPGNHVLQWAGRNDQGLDVAPGVYLCVLESRGARDTCKIVYLK